ncbi:MAG: PEGA domain-containing protein, partial [Calditrichaeota bacterium]
AQDTLVSLPRETAVAQEEADRPPSPGFLQVSCAPWAVVFIDDDSVGVTPLPDSLRFAPGEHNLVLRNPDFPEYATTVEIKSAEVHRVVFSFWETVGLLELDISPWAVVYVDGARRDTIPPQKHPLIVTPGKHQLSLENPDLGVWETELEVVAGETKHLRFNLRNLLTN